MNDLSSFVATLAKCETPSQVFRLASEEFESGKVLPKPFEYGKSYCLEFALACVLAWHNARAGVRAYIVFTGRKGSADQRVQGVFSSFEAAESDVLSSRILRDGQSVAFKKSVGMRSVFTAGDWVSEIHDFELRDGKTAA